MCCLFHVWSSPVKNMGPHFMIPYSSNPQRKGYTPTPSLHTPLHSSSNGKAAASSRLKGLCKELPNALRTPFRGRRFLNKQHPQAFKPAPRWGWGWTIPDFSYFEQGVSWWRGLAGKGWKPGSFHRSWFQNQHFDFQVISWLDKIGVSYNKIKQKQLRMRMGGDILWMVDWSFAEKASCPIWWNPVQAEDCPEGHDG